MSKKNTAAIKGMDAELAEKVSGQPQNGVAQTLGYSFETPEWSFQTLEWSFGNHRKARYDLPATVTGSNLSAVKKIGYHFINDQEEECDTPALDSATITCSADGTTLTISALPNAQSMYGIPQGTWDLKSYNDDESLIASLDNVEYVAA